MNYLAHSYLSCNSEDILIGNLITDMIRKKDEDAYDEGIKVGIDIHRQIDSYTDKHPIVRSTLPLLYPTQGKYAPVVLDIIWDYYLSKNWSNYSGVSLMDFTKGIYQILEKNKARLQPKVVVKVDNMMKHDFLNSCASLPALLNTFKHLDTRTKFDSQFTRAIDIVKSNNDQFQNAFDQMFPDLIQFTEANCDC